MKMLIKLVTAMVCVFLVVVILLRMVAVTMKPEYGVTHSNADIDSTSIDDVVTISKNDAIQARSVIKNNEHINKDVAVTNNNDLVFDSSVYKNFDMYVKNKSITKPNDWDDFYDLLVNDSGALNALLADYPNISKEQHSTLIDHLLIDAVSTNNADTLVINFAKAVQADDGKQMQRLSHLLAKTGVTDQQSLTYLLEQLQSNMAMLVQANIITALTVNAGLAESNKQLLQNKLAPLLYADNTEVRIATISRCYLWISDNQKSFVIDALNTNNNEIRFATLAVMGKFKQLPIGLLSPLRNMLNNKYFNTQEELIVCNALINFGVILNDEEKAILTNAQQMSMK